MLKKAKDFQMPKKLQHDPKKITDTFGKFTAEPLERGFGTTLGNSLRRVLLSSLEGSAITSLKITGVQHEFSSIPGVVEDTTDLILNLKEIIKPDDAADALAVAICHANSSIQNYKEKK